MSFDMGSMVLIIKGESACVPLDILEKAIEQHVPGCSIEITGVTLNGLVAELSNMKGEVEIRSDLVAIATIRATNSPRREVR